MTRAKVLAFTIPSYASHDYSSLAAVLDADPRILLDAGGGTGALVNAVIQQRATLRAVLLDRPEVIALAQHEAATGTAGRQSQTRASR